MRVVEGERRANRAAVGDENQSSEKLRSCPVACSLESTAESLGEAVRLARTTSVRVSKLRQCRHGLSLLLREKMRNNGGRRRRNRKGETGELMEKVGMSAIERDPRDC